MCEHAYLGTYAYSYKAGRQPVWHPEYLIRCTSEVLWTTECIATRRVGATFNVNLSARLFVSDELPHKNSLNRVTIYQRYSQDLELALFRDLLSPDNFTMVVMLSLNNDVRLYFVALNIVLSK